MRDTPATPEHRRAVARWMALVARGPRLVLAAVLLLLGLSIWAATGLGVDTDSSRMLDPGLPFQQRAHAVNEAFPQVKNTILVVVRGPRADPADAAVAELAAALEGRPGIERVFAPAAEPFFLTNGILYLDTETLDARLTRLSKSANMLASLRADQTLEGFLAALSEAGRLAERADIGPEALAAFHAEAAEVIGAATEGEPRAFAWMDAMSGDGDGTGPVTRVVSVLPEFDFAALNPARTAIEEVRAAVDGLDPRLARAVEVGVTGEPVLRAEELSAVAGRIGLSLALSMVIVAVVLRLALGTVGRMGLALGALLTTLVLTTGFAAVAIGDLNLVSVAFVVLMTGLGIDFAIHLMAHIDEDSRELPPVDAVDRTGATLGPALALGFLSTSAAFLAFSATDFIGMAQLGLIGGVGVAIAFAVAITLIPAVIALRPGLASGRPVAPPLPRGGGGTAPKVVAVIALVAGLAAAVVATQARFDADPMGLRDPDAPSVVAFGWLKDAPDTAPLRLSLLTEDRAEAAAAAGRLADLPEVDRATWLADLVPSDQDAKLELVDLAWPSLDFAVNGEPVAFTEPAPSGPEDLAADLGEEGAAGDLARALRAYAAIRTEETDAALEAELFRFFPGLMDRLAAQLDVDRVAEADLPEAIVERYRSAEGVLRVEIVPVANMSDPAARRAFVEAVRAAAPGAGGPPAQIEGAADTIAWAMIEASLMALGAAALLSVLVTRSLAAVAAILIPVALAGAVTMAASVLLGIPFNYANIIVLPLLIGIGVDSGIHLAMRTDRAGAVFDTSTPVAVFYSALTTVGAFATLALSEHRGTASMGVMLAIALLAAVVMAFALTPPIMRLARRKLSAGP